MACALFTNCHGLASLELAGFSAPLREGGAPDSAEAYAAAVRRQIGLPESDAG